MPLGPNIWKRRGVKKVSTEIKLWCRSTAVSALTDSTGNSEARMVLQSCCQLGQNGQTFVFPEQSVIDCGPLSHSLSEAEVAPKGAGSCGLSAHCTPCSWSNKPSRRGDLGGTSQWSTLLGKVFRDLRKKDLKPCQKLYLDMCVWRFTWLLPLIHSDSIQVPKLQNFPLPI